MSNKKNEWAPEVDIISFRRSNYLNLLRTKTNKLIGKAFLKAYQKVASRGQSRSVGTSGLIVLVQRLTTGPGVILNFKPYTLNTIKISQDGRSSRNSSPTGTSNYT